MKTFIAFVVLLLVWDIAAVPKDYVVTPGFLRHKSCVHEVESGSEIEETNGHGQLVKSPSGKRYYFPPCQYKAIRTPSVAQNMNKVGDSFKGGWQTYTKMKIDGITSFTGKFNVPDAPKRYSFVTLFLFPGLQNIDWVPPDDGPHGEFAIIQPVLQWGQSEAGGGAYWTLASWYVPLNGDSAIWSKLIRVQPGDILFGNITLLAPQQWYINSLDMNSGTKTDMTVKKTRLATMPWAYCTLEAYKYSSSISCDEYPVTPVKFTDLQLEVNHQQVDFQWTIVDKFATCGQHTTVVGKNEVDIFWTK